MSLQSDLHILGIPGSLRRGSYNRALLEAAHELAPRGVTVEIFDLHDLPLFNVDLEAEGLPEAVLAFRERLQAADALLIASPEYNYSITGVLKNAIDWASRRGSDPAAPLDNKPAAIIGAGGRLGTIRSQLHLREILSHNNVYVLNRPTLLVPKAGLHFDQDGRLVEKDTRRRLAMVLEALRDWTIALQKTELAPAGSGARQLQPTPA